MEQYVVTRNFPNSLHRVWLNHARTSPESILPAFPPLFPFTGNRDHSVDAVLGVS